VQLTGTARDSESAYCDDGAERGSTIAADRSNPVENQVETMRENFGVANGPHRASGIAVATQEDSYLCRLEIRTQGASSRVNCFVAAVAEARYVPNTQFLSIPFRSELIHSAA
jgi:hypothetical protein